MQFIFAACTVLGLETYLVKFCNAVFVIKLCKEGLGYNFMMHRPTCQQIIDHAVSKTARKTDPSTARPRSCKLQGLHLFKLNLQNAYL